MAKVSDDDMALMGRLLGRGEAGEKGAARIAALLDALNESESKLDFTEKAFAAARAVAHEYEDKLEVLSDVEVLLSQTVEQRDELQSRLDSCEERFQVARDAYDVLFVEAIGDKDAAHRALMEALSGVKFVKPNAEDIEACRRDLIQAGIVEKHERNCCEWHKAGGDPEYPCGGELLGGIPVYEQRKL
jgi:hypothetical protein